MENRVKISIGVRSYNEEGNIRKAYDEIKAVVSALRPACSRQVALSVRYIRVSGLRNLSFELKIENWKLKINSR